MKRHSIDWQARDLFEDPAGGWVEYDDARAVIDGLQALLNERDAELDRLRNAIGNASAEMLEALAESSERLP